VEGSAWEPPGVVPVPDLVPSSVPGSVPTLVQGDSRVDQREAHGIEWTGQPRVECELKRSRKSWPSSFETTPKLSGISSA